MPLNTKRCRSIALRWAYNTTQLLLTKSCAFCIVARWTKSPRFFVPLTIIKTGKDAGQAFGKVGLPHFTYFILLTLANIRPPVKRKLGAMKPLLDIGGESLTHDRLFIRDDFDVT